MNLGRRRARTPRVIREYRLSTECVIRAPIEAVFEFFSRAHNLGRLTPPWLAFDIVTPEPIEMREGTLIDYRIRLRGVPIGWRTRIAAWEPGQRFVDEQIKGPYALWRHEHRFEETKTASGEAAVRMIDDVRYALGWGWAGRLAHRVFVRRDLERIFDYRRQVIANMWPSGLS